MTICLGKSCSFGLLCVSVVNIYFFLLIFYLFFFHFYCVIIFVAFLFFDFEGEIRHLIIIAPNHCFRFYFVWVVFYKCSLSKVPSLTNV